MTARDFLIRGLIAGLLAGLATFLVAHYVGEPPVDTAIALEESNAQEAHAHPERAAEHTHSDGGTTEVSRSNQSTWGLATGTFAVALAFGGLLALTAAGLLGRLGPMSARQSTAVVALVGFIAIALVPFLKYPATPPAVGSGDTIGSRTGSYFGFLLVSLVVAGLCLWLATRLYDRYGAFYAVVGAGVAYVAAMVIAGQVFPTVNELGTFPADTLWYFRRSSLLTLATMWSVLGIVLAGLVGPLAEQARAATARRELAASL